MRHLIVHHRAGLTLRYSQNAILPKQTNANACKRLQKCGNGCKQLQTDANGCKWMQMDANDATCDLRCMACIVQDIM